MKRALFDIQYDKPTKRPNLPILPVLSTVDEAINYLHQNFPSLSFKIPIRPILLKSQIYALVGNRTKVDASLVTLQTSGKIRLLKIEDSVDDSVALMKFDDYTETLKDAALSDFQKSLFDRFSSFLFDDNRHLSVNRDQMVSNFSDEELSTLVQCGALTIKSSQSWWISSPSLGHFITSYRIGQRALLMMIKRTRFKELLLSEVLRRRLGKGSYLGHSYHLLAHIGIGTIAIVETSSGPLVRLTGS